MEGETDRTETEPSIIVRTSMRAAGQVGHESFGTVYATHRDHLVRLALLLCGDRELAQDVAADAFARTMPRWQRGEVDDVGPYLRRAVVNRLNTVWRRRALRRTHEQQRPATDHRGDLGADDRLAERDEVLAAVRRLPPRQRTAVVLRFYEDRSTAEIAAITGTSQSTVRSNLSRAAATLAEHLAPTPQEGR